MRIAFTGHRDCETTAGELDRLRRTYPDATWVHGGAAGFDLQVMLYARKHGIPEVVIRPDYVTHGRRAPLVRNHTIIEGAALLVACWDGRANGGTVYTMRIAREAGLKVHCVVASAGPG